MFTKIALQSLFQNGDGSPASGSIFVTPRSALVNYGDEAEQQSIATIAGIIDALGRVAGINGCALVVNATDDATTLPIGASYLFTVQLNDQGVNEFSSLVPHSPETWAGLSSVKPTDVLATTIDTSPVVTLVNLLAAESMIGAVVTGLHIIGSPTVISVDVAANTITLSANATFTGVDGEIMIAGGCCLISGLQANAL